MNSEIKTGTRCKIAMLDHTANGVVRSRNGEAMIIDVLDGSSEGDSLYLEFNQIDDSIEFYV